MNILKKLLVSSVCLFCSISVAQYTIDDKPKMKSESEKFSYILGTDMAQNFSKFNLKLTPELIYLGLKDALGDKKLRLSEKEIADTLKNVQIKMQAMRKKEMEKLESKRKEQGKLNQAKGDKFLAKNKKQSGVKVTKTGLQYKVIKEGSGKSPSGEEFVVVEYTGKLVDGKVFDSTAKTGKPVSFPVNGVIPGWQEALKLMKVGSEWDIVVPFDLAYGEYGQGPIGPKETLLFNVKLLKIQKNDDMPKSK